MYGINYQKSAYMVDSHETASNKFLVSAPFNIFFIMMHMKSMCAYGS